MTMNVLRVTFATLALSLLTGCMATRSISLQEARSYKLASLDVDAGSASVNWSDGEIAYMLSRGLDTNDPASADALASPEAKAAIRKALAEQVAVRMRPILAAGMTGARPVKVDVRLKLVSAPSTAARVVASVLIGSAPPGMLAAITVTDPATGRVLLELPDNGSTLTQASGVLGAAVIAAIESNAEAPPVARLADQQATNFLRWLLAE